MSLKYIPNPVHRYLMASYLYYNRNESVMTDEDFDLLARKLLDEYDYWGKHPHCPTEDDLRAGTYLGEYPQIVTVASEMYLRDVIHGDPL
jgi:hypothetical protein